PGERLERQSKPRHFLKARLRSGDHAPTRGVVLGAVPRTDEAAVAIDATVGEIGAEVAAAARNGGAPAVDVQYGPIADAAHAARTELGDRSDQFIAHGWKLLANFASACERRTRKSRK